MEEALHEFSNTDHSPCADEGGQHDDDEVGREPSAQGSIEELPLAQFCHRQHDERHAQLDVAARGVLVKMREHRHDIIPNFTAVCIADFFDDLGKGIPHFVHEVKILSTGVFLFDSE